MTSMESVSHFAEEINFRELQFKEVVGRGAFGMVKRAEWRGSQVAVKVIQTETEKKAFMTELKQLSRVCHPNIVRLYGACTENLVCLVMEYAEGGSLYNVLHMTPASHQPIYTCAHAMSWALQCAKGVEYLHNMKPKPLIHRDLKPPNLLLMNGGTVLKICDFGTACDAHTHMTNNKGSAAWMAPEVFEGSNYSEKCDVFSWGIILWEVITRQKPFQEIGGSAFRIMWAVHNGNRPPLVSGIPKTLETLMTRCWHANPVERPSMAEVVRLMSYFIQYFPGADVALVYPAQAEEEVPGFIPQDSSVYDTPPPTSHYPGGTLQATVCYSAAEEGDKVPVPMVPVTPTRQPMVIEDDFHNHRRTSAPASLAASRESLLGGNSSRSSTPSFDIAKRYSADLTRLEEWEIMSQGGSNPTAAVKPPGRGHRRTGSYGNSPVSTSNGEVDGQVMHASHTAPGVLDDNVGVPTSVATVGVPSSANRSVSWSPGVRDGHVNQQTTNTSATFDAMDPALNLALVAIDHQMQPLAPCISCPESMAIYDQHVKLAHEYLKVQTEIVLLTQRKSKLQDELKQDETEQQNTNRLFDEYRHLVAETESLRTFHNNLKQEAEKKHGEARR